jgi:hypothetical protein
MTPDISKNVTSHTAPFVNTLSAQRMYKRRQTAFTFFVTSQVFSSADYYIFASPSVFSHFVITSMALKFELKKLLCVEILG